MEKHSIKDLLLLLRNATLNEESQETINEYAKELADKLYVENSKTTYEQLLLKLGYINLPHHEFYKKRFNKKY